MKNPNRAVMNRALVKRIPHQQLLLSEVVEQVISQNSFSFDLFMELSHLLRCLAFLMQVKKDVAAFLAAVESLLQGSVVMLPQFVKLRSRGERFGGVVVSVAIKALRVDCD